MQRDGLSSSELPSGWAGWSKASQALVPDAAPPSSKLDCGSFVAGNPQDPPDSFQGHSPLGSQSYGSFGEFQPPSQTEEGGSCLLGMGVFSFGATCTLQVAVFPTWLVTYLGAHSLPPSRHWVSCQQRECHGQPAFHGGLLQLRW